MIDTVQFSLLSVGIAVCLIPLPLVQETFFGEGTQLSVWTLLVPLIGAGFVMISLASYHKEALQTISYGIFKSIDQIGLGGGYFMNQYSQNKINNSIEILPLSKS